MASRVSCARETARQGRPHLVRVVLYLSIYLSPSAPLRGSCRSVGFVMSSFCRVSIYLYLSI